MTKWFNNKKEKPCSFCGKLFFSSREHKTHCSTECVKNHEKEFQRKYRQRHKKEHNEQTLKSYYDLKEKGLLPDKREQSRKRYVDAYTSTVLKAARYKAKKQKIAFDLCLEDILIPEFCPILKIKLNINKGKVGSDSPSIERANLRLGYVKGNVFIISRKASNTRFGKSVSDYYEAFQNRHTTDNWKSRGTLEDHKLILEWLESNTIQGENDEEVLY